MYSFIGGNLVNQEKHAKREKEWDEVFQDELKDEAAIRMELEQVTVVEGNHRAEDHRHQQNRSRQNKHEEIDSFPPEKA